MIEKQTRDNKIEISKLAKETIKLSADIEDVGEALGEVQTAVTTATSGIAALEAATTALTEQTNTVEANVSALTQQTTALETQTSSLQIANVGINERLGVVESDLTTQNSTLANHASEIYAHESRITALENNSGNTGGGDNGGGGNTGGGNINPDNFGTKYYNVQDILALKEDYGTESFLGNTSQAKFPLCLIDANGPKTKIFFRVNPLYTQKPHIKLWFWISNIPTNLTEIPCVITLNEQEILSENLSILSGDHQAFVEFDVDQNSHDIVMFNTLEIHLNTTAVAKSFWDWVKVEITNTHNPLVLNRNTDYEIYGLRKGTGEYRIFSSKYGGNGSCRWIGGDAPVLENDNIVATYFGGDETVNNVRLRWGTRYPQQQLSETKGCFTYTLDYHLEYFITQENKFYSHYTYNQFHWLADDVFVENVMYAKKSLHNGANLESELACPVFTDFGVGLVNTRPTLKSQGLLLSPEEFLFTNEPYPKEFIDFIPVYDHNKTGLKDHKFSCGYFLHHISGNIIFVPETQSNYFIKIGKGRQVHAFLSQDNLKIDVFYQIGNNVVQKTLVRETEESEWELTDNLKYYLNVEDVVPFQDFYYTIKNRDIVKIDFENNEVISDNFGTKYYNVTDISELYNDYETESAFAATSTAKFPVCAIDASGPETSVYFRHNIKNKNTTPYIKLWFWVSGLPEDLTTIPCNITLNGNAVISTELTLLENTEDGHNFFCEFDIDPTLHTPKVFNDCHIKLNSTALAESFWDWVKVEISNCINPLILNRNTNYEISSLVTSSKEHKFTTGKFTGNGTWVALSGSNVLDDTTITTGTFQLDTINNVRVMWANRYFQQNFGTQFTYTIDHRLDFLITQDQKFYARYTLGSIPTFQSTTYFIENVRYAKKSLHNGINEEIEFACLAMEDFSVAVVHAHYNYVSAQPPTTTFFKSQTFNFNEQDYPKEFIDFVPILDNNALSSKTSKLGCGYVLHHQSGNILFVPALQSTYFIKVGKGRQVHAYLSEDGLSVEITYQVGNDVIVKTLTREMVSSDIWELNEEFKTYLGVEEVVITNEKHYAINNQEITQLEQTT